MDPEIEKIIEKQMEKLPGEVKQLFAGEELKNKITNIGTKNRLSIEELGTLQLEIYLVLLGLIHPDNFPITLSENLKIEKTKLDQIINEVNEQVFRDIREKLKEAYEKTNGILYDTGIIPENPDWQQNLNFILSGGDYVAFLEERNDKNSPQKGNMPKSNIPVNPKRMTDLRDKFTI